MRIAFRIALSLIVALSSLLGINQKKLNAATEDIVITIGSPQPKQPAWETLFVGVTINSQFELVSVTARVLTQTVNLASSGPNLMGTISLTGLARGIYTLTVTATDIFSTSKVVSTTFLVDQPPSMVITSPTHEYTLVRSALHVEAACQDDNPAGCKQISLWFPHPFGCGYRQDVPFALGVATLSYTVVLTQFEGATSSYCLVGIDSTNQVVQKNLSIFIESSQYLHEESNVGGHILDANISDILYSHFGGIGVRSRTTLSDTAIYTYPFRYSREYIDPNFGHLTTKGAVFRIPANLSGPNTLYELRDGQVISLATQNQFGFLNANEKWLTWGYIQYPNAYLWRRDIEAGVTTPLSTTAAKYDFLDGIPIGLALTPNGSVVYQRLDGKLEIDQNGLTRTTIYSGSLPITDGTLIAFQQSEGVCALGTFSDTTEIVLSNSCNTYQVNNGWVAFTKSTNFGLKQIWRRAPDGATHQASFFGTESTLRAIGPTGEITFDNNDRRYVSTPNRAALDIGNPWREQPSQDVWISDQLYRQIGPFLLSVLNRQVFLPIAVR
jgi:hypothetical protein